MKVYSVTSIVKAACQDMIASKSSALYERRYVNALRTRRTEFPDSDPGVRGLESGKTGVQCMCRVPRRMRYFLSLSCGGVILFLAKRIFVLGGRVVSRRVEVGTRISLGSLSCSGSSTEVWICDA
jgi:hypothetical protein